jgi:hypothetical protein
VTVGIATTRANDLLNTLRNMTTNVAIATPFVQLHTGDPGAAGTANISRGLDHSQRDHLECSGVGRIDDASVHAGGLDQRRRNRDDHPRVALDGQHRRHVPAGVRTDTGSGAWVSHQHPDPDSTFTPSFTPLAA